MFLVIWGTKEKIICIASKKWNVRNLILGVRGSVHTETATLNVKLTFVDVWVKTPDVRVVAEMTKTNFQNTMCNNSKTKQKRLDLRFQSDLSTFSTLYILSEKEWPCRNRGLPYSKLSLVMFRLRFFSFFTYTNSPWKTFFNRIFLPYRLRLRKRPQRGAAQKNFCTRKESETDFIVAL